MTRIISGAAGSLRLKGPAKATRPTSDRVKESLFSMLESQGRLEGCRVLDLYAGTGALGLESASRGASEVTLVELDRHAVEVIKANVAAISRALDGKTIFKLVSSDARAHLRREATTFDVIFLDPPYALPDNELLETLSLAVKVVDREGLIVIERDRRSPKIDPPSALFMARTISLGDTSLYFLEPDSWAHEKR